MADYPSEAPYQPICFTCKTAASPEGKPLLRCGRCKQQYYCSKACQAANWKFHKATCNVTANPSKAGMSIETFKRDPAVLAATQWRAVVMTPTGEDMQYGYIGSVIDEQGMSMLAWQELPATSAVGFQLRVAPYPYGESTLPNQFAELLSIDPSPVSSSFGQPLLSPLIKGGACVTRPSGGTMVIVQVSALANYLCIVMREIKAALAPEAHGETVDRKEIAKRLLTPAAFAEAFEDIKQAGVESEGETWASAECPVTLG